MTTWSIPRPLQFLAHKLYPPTDPVDLDFTDKTVLLTGANSGIGLEAARKLISLRTTHLILAVRNPSAADSLVPSIIAAAPPDCPRPIVTLLQLDLADPASISALVSKLIADLLPSSSDSSSAPIPTSVPEDAPRQGLQAAILNAGMFATTHRTATRFEQTLEVNTLGTVQLAMELLSSGLLRGSGPTRTTLPSSSSQVYAPPVLEFVNSGTHRRAPPPALASPNLLAYHSEEAHFALFGQYALSKLFLAACAGELSSHYAKLTEGTREEVRVISVCPGLCRSGLSREYRGRWWYRATMGISGLMLLRTEEEGARTLVSGLARGREGEGMARRIWQHDVFADEAEIFGKKPGFGRRVWGEVGEVLGGRSERVKTFLG